MTHDESAGLQNATATPTPAGDADDDDVLASALPTALTTRLFDAVIDDGLGLTSGSQLGQAQSGSAVVSATGGADGIESLSLAVVGGVSGLSAVDGGAITLAVDSGTGSLDNLVLGTDTGGDVVLAIYLGSDGKVTVVQYEAIDHPGGGTGLAHDNSVDIDDGILFAVVTDNDGDTASVDIGSQVKIEDDGPLAQADTNSVDEGSVTTGNVLLGDDDSVGGGDDDDFGTDGAGTPAITKLFLKTDGQNVLLYEFGTGTPQPIADVVTVSGDFGTLELNVGTEAWCA